MESMTLNTVGSDVFPPEELTLEEKISLLQRPGDSAPPADRVLDEHYKLSADDIADIQPGKWLSDKVVQTVFRRLTLLRPGKFYAIDSTSISTMAEIVHDLPEEAHDEFTRPVKTDVAMLTSTKGTVLMPFNVNGNHFILVTVRLAERAIYIYDSTRESDENNNLAAGYRQFLEEFARERVVWLLDFEPREISVIPLGWHSVPCPQQDNDFDCGVSICLTAMHLISHPESPWTFTRPQFSVPGVSSRYIRGTYWLAGRRIILELCRPYADLSDEKVREALELTGAAIDRSFTRLIETHGRRGPEEEHYDAAAWTIACADGHRVAPALLQSQQEVAHLAVQVKWLRQELLAPVLCINADLIDILNYVREIGTASTVDRDLAIQRQAPHVVVSEGWLTVRPEVVKKAVEYAWHDVNEIKKVRDDLARATTALLRAVHELYMGPGAAVPSLETLMENERVHRGSGS